ncbi:energy transducer TonB [Veillonella magna]|uniref:energy transducer TonB n=1 Tax=Veillonella magna TaxID=464322 RepID=UPI0023F0C622|nr:energy transducer TonB [Veillonella magna]
MCERKRWQRAYIASLAVNTILIGCGAWYLTIAHEVVMPSSEPIEVTITDAGGGGSLESNGKNAVGPTISVPRSSKVVIPPMPTSLSEAEAMVQESVKTVEMNTSTHMSVGDFNESAVGNGGEDGTGGSGAGAGVGSGIGNGDGNGGGTGDGNGPGSGGSSDGGGEDSDDSVHDVGSLMPLHTVAPIYPERLRKRGISGQTVVCRLVVERDGSVSSVSVISSSGYGAMDRAAVNALYQWTFSPVIIGGHAVRVTAVQPVTFRLQ